MTRDKFAAEIRNVDTSETKIHSSQTICAWENIKISCTEFAQKYAIKKHRIKNTLLNDLYKYKATTATEQIENDVTWMIDAKIKELEMERLHSSMFCAKCNWEKHGEGSSKYFFSLEKRNFNNKTMFSIIKDGKICTEQEIILKEQVKFYKALYTADPETSFTLKILEMLELIVYKNTFWNLILKRRKL